ncbi:MAG: hypothetical protein M3371_14495, partial [Acidobacteriota bacterium]|nr:hypothetical protein [Acidobacteriota bacterium]
MSEKEKLTVARCRAELYSPRLIFVHIGLILSMPPLGASTILLPKIFPQFKVKELSQFPIRTINFSDTTERVRHDRMVTLV